MSNKEKTILACIDGSSYTEAVCDYAAWMAARIGVPLTLLHNLEHPATAAVADLSGSIGLGSREELLGELTEVEQRRNRLLLEKGKLMLEGAKGRVAAAGIDEPLISQRHGSLTESLIDLEADTRALVLGLRGERHEGDEKGVGAHLEPIVRALHTPILVVNKAFAPPERIMLAYDGGEACRKAVDMVSATPLFEGIPCHLVHVGDAEALLEDAAETLRQAGKTVETAMLSGRIDNALCQYQAENGIDMTVMGAFSHTRIRDILLGSFTARMLARTQQPLLLLR